MNRSLIVAKDDSGGALKEPLDYTLVWSSESLKIKQDGNGYCYPNINLRGGVI